MSLSLAQIAGELGTGTFMVRGKDYPSRGLSAHETMVLQFSKPKPLAPLKHDPNRGSGAPRIVDDRDEEYRRELERWMARTICATVAVGGDIEVEGQPPWSAVVDGPAAGVVAWMEAAGKQLLSKFSYAELMAWHNEIEKLGEKGLGAAMQRAEGN